MICCQAARRLTCLFFTLLAAALSWALAAPGAAQKKGQPAIEKDSKDKLPRIHPTEPADDLDILYARDTNGDGKADVVRKVFTGFSRSNVQGLLNSFQWGLDNRIHGATSSNGGQVRRADDPAAKPINIGGRNFSFDPRAL